MRIVLVEVRNFRGIRTLDWTPSPGMNCLIGPGDATKTTILDAIELALSPRTNYLADDTDFYNLDFTQPATVTITVVGLPDSFRSDARYGFHLRGWDETAGSLSDEPDDSLEDALSIRVSLDASTLEGRWSLFHLRLDPEAEPPSLRFADARDLAPTRLGPYADRHLGWGRQSVLNRIGLDGRMTGQLAAASRAAREAFRSTNKDVFAAPVAQAEKLSRHFSVRVRDGFTAELDVQGSAITVFDDRGVERCFDQERYDLSKGLRALLAGLPGTKVYQTPEANFAIITTRSGREYRVFFNVRKMEQKKRLRLYVESAYSPDSERAIPAPVTAYQRVKFNLLCDTILDGKPAKFHGR
ncbi:MAG: AAA family ATPase [Alphaproteobacteria bacterium]|jgi:hypothetical protein|nr:AAA family ATPase [Alphaproteobacteria bacterium]MBU2041815.1 AAA family ATPase [Alphaproteobacteria bacterium]MBU2124508.1 AAA family ATPase [Alphaproteobacteria bacterium]MBU2209747.1 AAA family ATPase [Alphaproteobacteria bacterium]MBU2291863.1 AAA family ATPase [Alphaproteobacteria bacterium]